MKLEISKDLFGILYDYIKDDNVTDIKWNGHGLWINDLTKGRFLVRDENEKPVILSEDFLKIFTGRIANSVNENFNVSTPSLKAECESLRIQAMHDSISDDGHIALAIRKTPSIARLAKYDLIKDGYVDEITARLLPVLMLSRMSGIITGDVGAGKTELEKYLAGFIKDEDGIFTIEDTLEMKLKTLYPDKDIYSVKIDENYGAEDGIRDALRMMTKWLILSEARGREIKSVMEASSTGCSNLVSIHAENVWEIPDRILNMAQSDVHSGFENDIYTFFDYAIKVKADITDKGIKRSIDQLCFFDRQNKENSIVIFMIGGNLTYKPLPDGIVLKMINAKERGFITWYNEIAKRMRVNE